MRRLRSNLVPVVIFLCLAALVPRLQAERPNIVWLISEDNSKHYLKLFDPHGAETPHIAAMARDGLVFTRAFSNAPVCSVARTTLITGCYAPRLGAQYHRRSAPAPLPAGLKLFPAYLRDAGYYTSNRFKTDYNVRGGTGAWDDSSRRATWRNRQDGQPFFHMQSFPVSHEGRLHFPPGDVDSVPVKTDPASVFLNPNHPDTKLFRYTTARYHDRIMDVDAQIGRVIDELRADGLLEDTFVFYFGDHGGVLPGSKGYACEAGLHVPLVVRIPKKWKRPGVFPRGARVDGFVSFIDFGPTVLNLAGVRIPAQMDGRPFLGRDVEADQMIRRNTTFGYADRFDEKIDFVRTVRVGRFKYVRNYQPFNYDGLQNNYRYIMAVYAQWRAEYDAGNLTKIQRRFFEPRPPESLYDVEADPWETQDLAQAPQHQQTLSTLRRTLNDHLARLPDLSFFPESEFLGHGLDNPTRFGRDQAARIKSLIDLANTQLVPAAAAEPIVRPALQSPDPLRRMWGLIVCTTHGRGLASLLPEARRLAGNDPHLLVRTRAAEFLALTDKVPPGPVLVAALKETRDVVQANEILNSVAMLRDGPQRFTIPVTRQLLHASIRDTGNVKRRLDYLTSSRGRGERWQRAPRRRRRTP